MKFAALFASALFGVFPATSHSPRVQSAPKAESSQQAQSVPAQLPQSQPALSVSIDVLADKLVHYVPPLYPQIAQAAHVSGTVVLHAFIGTDGAIRQLTFISGPALLRTAAMVAVEKWRFEPTLLNGQPVEVETAIPVRFTMGEPEFTFKHETREPRTSREMLTESIDITGPGKKKDWSGFVSAFGDATSRAWLAAIPSSASEDKGKAIVSFALHRDGSIDGPLWLVHSSGNSAVDAASRLAVRKCAPFHGVPNDLRYPYINLRVTFAYGHPHPLTLSAVAAR